tara:strand:+ start:3539 stop:4567 length:1029 start_codon:yes stop_codon:yes gene_type:complete
MKCCYCASNDHHIGKCTKDPHLENLLTQDIKPNFYVLPYKTLRRIAKFTPYKSSLPKYKLAYLFLNLWEFNFKEREKLKITETEDKNENESGTGTENESGMNINESSCEDECCCICMEKSIQGKNIAVLNCGHTFCLQCILIHHQRSNNCPLCRNEYSTYIPPARAPLPDSHFNNVNYDNNDDIIRVGDLNDAEHYIPFPTMEMDVNQDEYDDFVPLSNNWTLNEFPMPDYLPIEETLPPLNSETSIFDIEYINQRSSTPQHVVNSNIQPLNLLPLFEAVTNDTLNLDGLDDTNILNQGGSNNNSSTTEMVSYTISYTPNTPTYTDSIISTGSSISTFNSQN